MSCPNKVTVNVPTTYHYKQVELNCGNTGPDGTRTMCDACIEEAKKQYPQGWVNTPGDTCKHGTYLNPEHDCCCGPCENGDPSPAEYIFQWVRTGPMGEGSCSSYSECSTDDELKEEIARHLTNHDTYHAMDFMLELECIFWERQGMDTTTWYEHRKELFREMHEYRTEFDMAIELWKTDKIDDDALVKLLEIYGVPRDLRVSIMYGGKEKPYDE